MSLALNCHLSDDTCLTIVIEVTRQIKHRLRMWCLKFHQHYTLNFYFNYIYFFYIKIQLPLNPLENYKNNRINDESAL